MKAKTKKARFEYFKIPNSTPESYSERLIDIPSRGSIICGIRHYSGLKEKPSLINEFKIFNPKYLRYYSKRKIESNETGGCYLVQQSSKIKHCVKFNQEDDLELLSPQNTDYYKWYIEEYKQFHKSYSELADKVQFNSKELMEASRKDGLLKEVLYKGESIGLIAAIKEDFLGHKAIYFIELLTKMQWRKKGFAKAMQRKFIVENTNENELVWGMVDIENQPSFKTATANSRKIVRCENFLPVVT